MLRISNFELCLSLLAALILPASVLAAKKTAPPPSTILFPAGAQRGSTATITLSSKLEGTGQRLQIDCPGVYFWPGEKGAWQVHVAPDAPTGVHLVRVITDNGATEPRWFSIGTLPEITEKEPNDALGAEQVIDKLPVCINGQLEKRGTADLFAFTLAKDQSLVAKLEAYELGSNLDAFLELRDEQRAILATVHDGRNLDPTLVFKAEKAGRYTLQVAGFVHPPAADVSFAGGTGLLYRLSLSTGPAALRVYPAAVSRKAKNTLSVEGFGLSDAQKTLNADTTLLLPEPLVQGLTVPGALGPVPVAVVNTDVQREKEPNNDVQTAPLLKVPATAAGHLDKLGDVDAWSFEAKKGVYYNLRLLAKTLDLPMEPRLVIVDARGQELASQQTPSEPADPVLSWKAPADGKFTVLISDLYSKAADGAAYVLDLGPGEESFGATISGTKSAFLIEPGSTLEIKAKLKRVNGYAGDLTARLSGLPPGVTCAEIQAPKKNGEEFTLKLEAAANAAPANVPLQLTLWTKPEKDKPLLSRAALLDLRGELKRGIASVDDTPELWLTVTRKAE